ncbi:Do family serine endopeptidase [Parapusillimonas granuli]|uniref:Probable periplasmic serine endoprotease DegP-like n=1 Tax=Parapusillimonas granuli TaxID=380911 RepID=A0A853G9H7_9BURK|nr:Do family serine endopeptidase [Parapusillimonas granuli]MEB2400105.1 Do family serine endopeptidase [Alcaligenaceae bacterium]NYT51580.1 Do family serine endopeptidase [Parapusillimonas granuli]
MQFIRLGSNRVKRIAACAAVGVAMALTSAGMTVNAQPSATPTLAVPDFTQVVEQTEGSVVNIRTTESVPVRRSPMGPGPSDPYEMFRWFFGPDFMPPGMPGPRQRNAPTPPEQERTVPRGVGSGFIISSDGYILTNNHVVAKSNGIFVTLTSGKEYKAKVIGTDPRTDVALIKIDAQGLTPLPIGDSTKLKKGQWVLAIGSPFGLDSTVTAGIVSAINRDTGDYLPFIQTDVAVNPGNSGGPLINLAGQVVGVNSQIISQSGGFMGISLAIPIDEAMRVVDQLKAHGKVTRGRIGVQIGSVSEDVAKAIGLESAKGAMVSNVEPNGPAAQAGVRSGDVITRFDGKQISQMSDLPRIVGGTKPGSRVPMDVWRKGKTITLQVKVGEMPSADEAGAGQGEQPKAEAADALGLKVIEVSDTVREKLDIKGGVQVAQVEEPAAAAGLAPGDIIITINDVDITSPAQYAKVVAGLSPSRAAALLVIRGDQSQWVTITPRK